MPIGPQCFGEWDSIRYFFFFTHTKNKSGANSILFVMQEGYFDCQMALKFDYPREKILKLLHRKVSLALSCKRKDYVEESIRELEKYFDSNEAVRADDTAKC